MRARLFIPAVIVAAVAAGLSSPVSAAIAVLAVAGATAFLLGRLACAATGCAPRAERIGTILSAMLGVAGLLTVVMGGVWWYLGALHKAEPVWPLLPLVSAVAFLAGALASRPSTKRKPG